MRSLRMSESEIQAMKETLCDQQQLLQKLYNELDVEREASSTAASEALSMILRLQGEKAAVKMEANQYKRLAEEKICHAEEALAIFEDVICQKEMEIASLEYQVQSYSYKLSSLGCSYICFCESKYPENMLQRNEKLLGNMGAQILLRRNSLPAIPLPKKGNPDLISENMNYENKNQSSIVEKKFEKPAVGDINSYWEQIKRLDERVREIADGKGVDSSNAKSRSRSPPLLDLAREAGATKSRQIQHPENLLENEAATNLSCCSSVHDVFEDSHIFENDEGRAGQTKQQCKLISKSSERLVCPESVLHRAIKLYVKDETDGVEQISLSTDPFRPVDEVAIDCHSGIGQPGIGVAETRSKFQQFHRMEIVEDYERNAADSGEEKLKLLKEIQEQLNFIEAEIRSWQTKKSSPSYDLPLLTLTEGSREVLRPSPFICCTHSVSPTELLTSAKLASTASFSPSPRAQLHTSWGTISLKPNQKLLQSPNFPFISSTVIPNFSKNHPLSSSSSSSSSFPHNLKLPSLTASVSTQLQPLSDSTDESLVENLEELANMQSITNGFHQIAPRESIRRVFIQDPPWITSLFMKNLYKRSKQGLKSEFQEVDRKKYYLLRRRQIRAETEAWEKMVEEYRELEREMCEKKLAPNLPYVKKLFLGWFEPLREAIAKEQRTQRTKKQKAAFAPYIDSLTADKMAIIVMYKMMALLMAGKEDRSVRVVQAAVQIGVAIEQEVQIHSFLEKTKRHQRKKIVALAEEGFSKDAEMLRKRVKSLIRRKKIIEVQKLVKNEEVKPWGRDTQAKLGCRLIELLTETAYVQPPIDQSADSPLDIRPAFRHMFRISNEPGQKIVKRYGVIECDPLVLAGLDKTAKHMIIPYVPMLVPPKKWKGYDKGGYMFLPSYLMRTHGSKHQQEAVKNVAVKQMQKVYEALDTLGNTKWRVNRRVLSVVESIWAGGGNIGGLVDRKDVPIPERPQSEDLTEIKRWKWSVRKAKKINQELYSQRCDTELKLSVARRMKGEEGFYYPHNLDFRGRAYPMHPHLNHLSSDLCRGVLEFAEGRPLGKSGLRWLKIHLASLYGGGVEKLSYNGRLAFVENHLDDVLDSADKPLNGNRWWLTGEDPFQCLAACINLSEALKSPSPRTVISHLPIHQDGSCNGLQHYAALGRDALEAAAVNLVAGEKPADVYSEIAARVHDIMKRDSNKDPATYPNALLAKILIGQVDRKLVKQTVMTSVYGVTYVGAREQIKRRLKEKGHITDDGLLFNAACYAAKVTMAALGEIFEAARGIMGWLGDCAKVIASENQPVRWTTPLGLPVVQPYFKTERHVIRTSLQVLALQREGDSVEVRKQRTAFPPNFVHSLDGSHMMMTAVACRDAGLRFAGVHDSFWTHACDVDTMNRILREKFVELYDMPILENLLKSFQRSYPGLTFPALPDRGDFDLQQVLESPYFFN